MRENDGSSEREIGFLLVTENKDSSEGQAGLDGEKSTCLSNGHVLRHYWKSGNYRRHFTEGLEALGIETITEGCQAVGKELTNLSLKSGSSIPNFIFFSLVVFAHLLPFFTQFPPFLHARSFCSLVTGGGTWLRDFVGVVVVGRGRRGVQRLPSSRAILVEVINWSLRQVQKCLKVTSFSNGDSCSPD
ncbi:hypothetical protein LR48_Vigan03g180900 [Vigna angularis]|uniref:Uncharacterized protein n=1 Tax=Phaseolus angularis TaxID=3914 RepID=A0A0L9U6X6_PHAAN|nr:hypothetical protein LR48_Vigan03g180900 [Vigna angularis]